MLIEDEIKTYQRNLPLPEPAWPGDVQTMFAYVHKHLFEEELSVEAAKRHCGIRDNNISSRFAYYVGCGIKKYINAHRLKAAKRLMQHTDVKIFEIALALGYSSQGAFTMAFQRYQGCCPTAFRAMQKNVKIKMKKNVNGFVKQKMTPDS